MKLLFSLEETAKAMGVTERKLLQILGVTQAKARDKLARKSAVKKLEGGKK